MKSARFAVLAALVSPFIAQADELVLEDGSRLLGTLKAVEAEVVVFETAFAGTVEVQRDMIRGIQTDSEWRLVFGSGERVVGRMQWDEAQGQRLKAERTGVVALDAADLVALEVPGTPVMESAEARAAAVWSSEISILVNGASGNTDEFGANPRFSALRETEFDRIRFGLQGRFARQDGEETENEVIGTAGIERDFTERWFGFAGLRLERDELENLDLRTNIDLGSGWFLVREPDHEFKPRLGIGVQIESYQGSDTREDLVGVAGWDYRRDIGPSWKFTHTLDYRPTFSDPTGAYRVDSEAALTAPLSDGRWGVMIRLRNEYNADPEPGIEELDTIYSLGLQRSFD